MSVRTPTLIQRGQTTDGAVRPAAVLVLTLSITPFLFPDRGLAEQPTTGGKLEATRPAAAPRPGLAQVEQFAPADEFVMVNSVKTHHLRRGERGRPIVLLHGFGSSTYTWRRNLDELARGHRVFAFDLKGFGLTAKPKDGRYHIPAYVEHLLGYLDAMKLERPVLIGSSMGGAVAVHLALRHPERVSGLVLVDAAPTGLPNWSGRGERRPDVQPQAANAGAGVGTGTLAGPLLRAMITRQAIGKWLKVSYHDPSLVTEEMIETYYRPITIEGAVEALAAMARPQGEPTVQVPPLSSLRCPTLLIWGAYDRIIPRAVADEYARSIPESRLLIFERSGHLPHEEEPERFGREVAGFVDHLP